jgi:hypothetical protein
MERKTRGNDWKTKHPRMAAAGEFSPELLRVNMKEMYRTQWAYSHDFGTRAELLVEFEPGDYKIKSASCKSRRMDSSVTNLRQTSKG